MDNSREILNNYGGLSSNSLVEILQSDGGENDDEPTILEHSMYFQIDAMACKIKGKHGFKILSLNCQSLRAKVNQLTMYVNIFQGKNLTFDAICLQETWLSCLENISDLNLPNYNLISQGKSCSSHGGLAIYLHKKYHYQLVPSLESTNTNWEYQIIDIKLETPLKKKLRIGNIYRLPRETSTDSENFLSEFSDVLQHYSNSCSDMVLCGDFNINLLKINEKPKVNEFFETMLSNGFVPKITLPTRFSDNSATLIDNIFCKLSTNFSKTTTGILMSKISDHQPYFVCLDYLCSKSLPPKYVKIQKFPLNKLDEFKSELESLELNEKFTSSNPNDNFELFHSEILRLKEKHFPVKFVKYCKHKHKKNIWMTAGLLKSIQYRDKLYAEMKRTARDTQDYFTLKTNLSTYNKILKTTIREAKQLYYHSLFRKYKHDIKNTWNVIKDIIQSGRDCNDLTTSFSFDGIESSDPDIIANKFNEYFCNIGPLLAGNINCPPSVNFTDYLSEPVSDDFKFARVSLDIVDKVIIIN